MSIRPIYRRGIAMLLLSCVLICFSTPVSGTVVTLDLPADLCWWNGCSPTVAAMLFGWWEEHGYDSFPGDHRNVPASYPLTSSSPADYSDARGIIAGWANKQEGIALGLTYGSYFGHTPSSLADFLLTTDGNTSRDDMAHGLETFGAWDDRRTPDVESHRFTATTAYISNGWTYNNYVAEINAGRPVFLGLETNQGSQHSMLGVGYDNTGGKTNIQVMTTAGNGMQSYDWANVQYSGQQYHVYGATLLQPDPSPSPQLSAYFFLSHSHIGDLEVEIGVGNPNQPTWKKTIWNQGGGSSQNLILTDIDLMAMQSAAAIGNLDWYLKVKDNATGLMGYIEDFQIRNGRDKVVYKFNGTRVPINDLQTSYVFLHAGTNTAAGAMDVDVRNGGVLRGTSTINGLVTVMSGGTLAASAGRPLTVDRIGLENGAVIASDVAGPNAAGLTVNHAITWNGQIVKSDAGSYTLNYNGDSVAMAPNAILDIQHGRFAVGGTSDPFTDTTDVSRHLSITAEDGVVLALLGPVTPVMQNVTISGNVTLEMNVPLVANSLTIGAGAILTLAPTNPNFRLALNAKQVPEPGIALLALSGLVGYAFRFRHHP